MDVEHDLWLACDGGQFSLSTSESLNPTVPPSAGSSSTAVPSSIIPSALVAAELPGTGSPPYTASTTMDSPACASRCLAAGEGTTVTLIGATILRAAGAGAAAAGGRAGFMRLG